MRTTCKGRSRLGPLDQRREHGGESDAHRKPSIAIRGLIRERYAARSEMKVAPRIEVLVGLERSPAEALDLKHPHEVLRELFADHIEQRPPPRLTTSAERPSFDLQAPHPGTVTPVELPGKARTRRKGQEPRHRRRPYSGRRDAPDRVVRAQVRELARDRRHHARVEPPERNTPVGTSPISRSARAPLRCRTWSRACADRSSCAHGAGFSEKPPRPAAQGRGSMPRPGSSRPPRS